MSSIFSGARNTTVSHSRFTNIGRDQHQTTIHTQNIKLSREKDEILSSLMPADRGYYVPPCMEGTRNAIFETVDRWLFDVDAPNILLISGSPGVGKSTIASSLVSRLSIRGQRGASLFFNRGVAALSNPSTVWRTVAFDLAKSDPAIARRLMKNVKEGRVDPARPDIELHFKYLVEEPLKHKETAAIFDDGLWDSSSWNSFLMSSGKTIGPGISMQQPKDDNSTKLYPVVILDALDECGSDRSQSTQRRILLKTLTNWSRLPSIFKLIVTSRDDGIPRSFRDVCFHLSLDTGDLVSSDSNRDVQTFFETRFAEIAAFYPSLVAWPDKSIIMQLTSRAAGLFIWADTVVRFVEQGVASEQLDLLLASGFREGGDRVDALYAQILDLSFRDCKADIYTRFTAVVGAIVLAKAPLRRSDLKLFVGTRDNEPSVDFILQRLSSVILTGENDGIVRVCHLTFTEFVCSSERFGEPFFISQTSHSTVMALTCMRNLNTTLKFNICALETSYLRNSEVMDLSNRVEEMIPVFLLYSCRFFAEHLQDITRDKCDIAVVKEIELFLHNHLLFWLEIMSLRKWVDVAVTALQTVVRWLKVYSKELSEFAADAEKFVIDYQIPISASVPHIYLSALPLAARESRMSRHYQPRFSQTLYVPALEQRRLTLLDTLMGSTRYGWSGSFPPDGRSSTPGSGDGVICTWDADTGKISSGTSDEHTKYVWSATFSPDGRGVVSVTGRRMITTLTKGEFRPSPFDGDIARFTSITISPSTRRVAAYSTDRTMHIWHADTGKNVSSLPGMHTNRVTSLAFSPDAKRVVSGSWDRTIHIWDANTGQVLLGPLQGHLLGINSVAFAPDGKRVVSGSDDETLRIWDAETDKIMFDPLKGHDDQVITVMFSPDGKRIVSGSDDRTIRIWDVETGSTVCDPLRGHTARVTSVAFSASGRRVVSGSVDRAIRVWDANTGQLLLGPLRGHSGAIFSVGFSPDERRLISVAVDQTIRIWHADPVESFNLFCYDGWMLHDPDNEADETQGSYQRLLFWVPPEWRKGICGNETVSIMGVDLTRPNFSRFVHGTSWGHCYTPQPTNHPAPSTPSVRFQARPTSVTFIILLFSAILYFYL